MSIILIVSSYVFIQMCVIWGLYKLLKNPSVVDVSWSIGLMISGLIYLFNSQPTNKIIVTSTLLSIWALRLAGYLWYTRVRHGHVDKRYTKLSDDWKISKSLGFFLNFQLQGILIIIISSVFFWVAKSSYNQLNIFDFLGIFLIIIGISGESLADFQLQKFRKTHKGEVCNYGLWNYTRHPNYFFDWLTWLGFACLAFEMKYGFIGLIAPLMMYIIFTKMTGPMTERGSIQSRGQKYISYQQKTPMFFPKIKS
ncbi:MAG: DUF1295 domain-containing protein [Legionellaceae bacterium]|nr:DUF1295 domain-containing protein [Legionellaceae bacterium]